MRNKIVVQAVFCSVLAGAAVALGASYEAEAVSNGGTIEGSIKLSGVAPALPPIHTTKNQDYCGLSIPNPLYLVSKSGGLANVEVFIQAIDKGKPNPTGSVTLTNKGCMFTPRVQGASVGQKLKITSDDPILHNTHPQIDSTSATLYNVALPFKGFSVEKPLPATPDLIRVKCDVHEWMRAWIWEFSHPYYATTDADGHFKITEVPAGSYTLVAWDEVMGQQTKPVTVSAGKSAGVDFSFAPKK